MNTPIHPAPTLPSGKREDSLGVAHAKAILIGEHSVVYSAPAIAIPVHALEARARIGAGQGPEWSLECRYYSGPVGGAPAEIAPVVAAWRAAVERLGQGPGRTHLSLDSTVPIQRGLGSSAAVAASIVAAVAADQNTTLDARGTHELIQRAEAIAHGKPSGIDAAAVVADAPIEFRGGEIRPVKTRGTFTFVIADSGTHGATSRAVAAVRARRDDAPAETDALIGRLAALTGEAKAALGSADVSGLGSAMDRAHEALALLGVSSDRLDSLTGAARGAGAAGAKLTGGGLGGCIIALASGTDTAGLEAGLRGAGATGIWTTTLEGGS